MTCYALAAASVSPLPAHPGGQLGVLLFHSHLDHYSTADLRAAGRQHRRIWAIDADPEEGAADANGMFVHRFVLARPLQHTAG